MSHAIDMTNGKPAVAYVGQVPWHGLGEELEEDASLDEWRIAAGLDWEVRNSPVMFMQPDEGLRYVDNKNVLYRSDTGGPLGLVSDQYKIVQPNDVLEFYRSLAESQGFTMETAGSLQDGKRVWALARTGREFSVMGQDLMKAYLLLATSYDGTMATVASFTSVRVVCQNTLSFAVGNEGQRADIRIPHHSAFEPDSIKRELGLDENWEQFEDRANTLAKRKVTKKEALEFFTNVLYGDEIDEEELPTASRTLKQVMDVYENGVGQETRSANGTAWGLVNAVTRWTDHERNARSSSSRLNSAWFGPAANKKRTAFETALELAA
jgi:phage/plasmid-like protein (TIGR03299 family)